VRGRAFIALLLLAASLRAATERIGPRPTGELEAIASKLKPGDVLEVEGGATWRGQITLRASGSPEHPITIRGVGSPRPVIATSGGVAGGAVVRFWGSHCVFENFEITGERDKATGRGLYVVADDVTIRDTLVRDVAGQGVQGSDSAGSLTLERVEVRRCGSGMFAHQVYVGTDNTRFPGAVFRMQGCYVHEGLGGNNVKSRAGRTELYGNWIEGSWGHELDLIGADPKGQHAPADAVREDADIVGNVLLKRPRSIGGFARLGTDTTGASNGRYRFFHNTFVVDPEVRGLVTVCKVREVETVEATNNVFFCTAAKLQLIDGQPVATTGANNWVTNRAATIPASWIGTLRGDDPGFRNAAALDFRLKAGSPLTGAGAKTSVSPPGFEFPKPLVAPSMEPPAPGQPTKLRERSDTPDIGAFGRTDP
jgi:hypothetical protein